MDNDLCSDVLQDALETIQALPPALLSQVDDADDTTVCTDVLAKTQAFLRSVVLK